jgi:hypothetical protein
MFVLYIISKDIPGAQFMFLICTAFPFVVLYMKDLFTDTKVMCENVDDLKKLETLSKKYDVPIPIIKSINKYCSKIPELKYMPLFVAKLDDKHLIYYTKNKNDKTSIIFGKVKDNKYKEFVALVAELEKVNKTEQGDSIVVELKENSDNVEPKENTDNVELKGNSDNVEPKGNSDNVELKENHDIVEPSDVIGH